MATTKPWQELREAAQDAGSESRAASVVLRHFGIRAPIVPVEILCKHLGVRVEDENLGKALGVLDSTKEDPIIKVHSGHSPAGRRLTVAHELGHLLLHPLGTYHRDDVHVSMFATPVTLAARREQQANKFAASLLIPLYWLEPYVMVPGTTAEDLARSFGVSPSSILWQLERLR